jgi:branched-subunit amino acid transport protein AzlD
VLQPTRAYLYRTQHFMLSCWFVSCSCFQCVKSPSTVQYCGMVLPATVVVLVTMYLPNFHTC